MNEFNGFTIPNEFKELLTKVREEQIKYSEQVSLENKLEFGEIVTIAGLDVAYSEKDDFACAGIVVIDFRTFEILEEQVEFFSPSIPYIPSFLHYRESPGYHKVISKLNEKPDVMIFDGNGLIHPFGFGLACQMGLETNLPSFGVAKNLLFGIYEPPLDRGGFSEINYNNKIVGAAFQTLELPAKPVFISSGHLVNLNLCVNIMREFVLHQNYPSKLPLPLNLADKLVREKLLGKV